MAGDTTTPPAQAVDVVEVTRGHLEQAWGADYSKHFEAAQAAFQRHAEPGQNFDDIMTNPAVAYRLLAKMGAASGGGGQGAVADDAASIKKLLVSEAASNPKHPEHKATRARIDSFYQRQYGNQEALR